MEPGSFLQAWFGWRIRVKSYSVWMWLSFRFVSSRSFRKGLRKCLLLLAQAKQKLCKLVYHNTH